VKQSLILLGFYPLTGSSASDIRILLGPTPHGADEAGAELALGVE
jgi:hypothetical protein